MGFPYYFSQALAGVTGELDRQRSQKAKQAEAEAEMRSKMLGYKFLLDQQKQAQESSERRDRERYQHEDLRDTERAKREALLEGIKGGDERSGRMYDELFGLRPDRRNLPDVIATGESSPMRGVPSPDFGRFTEEAKLGPMQSAALTTFNKAEAERLRKQSDLDLERDYKEQMMLESKSRIRENDAQSAKLRKEAADKGDKADIKDNIKTIEVALNAFAKEEGFLNSERDKMFQVYKGRIPSDKMGRINQIERRIAEIGVEKAAKQRRLDTLREGSQLPAMKQGKLSGAHESYYLVSQLTGRRAIVADLAKKLMQDGRAKSLPDAYAKASEYINMRGAAKKHLMRQFDFPEGTDIEEAVDRFLDSNPNVTTEDLR